MGAECEGLTGSMQGKSLYDFPIHLGSARGRRRAAIHRLEWYEAYGSATPTISRRPARQPVPLRGELDELGDAPARAMKWSAVVQGHMTLHQELPDGASSTRTRPRRICDQPAGAWHTADADEPVVALFITAGKGTTNRPR